MAESQNSQKRTRDEKSHDGSLAAGAGPKRLKPYDSILNLLDEEEDEVAEPSHELSRDLSAIFATLQKELSDTGSPPAAEAERRVAAADEDDGLKLSVMRHLLEASDDELGIPNRSSPEEVSSGGIFNSDSAFNDDGLLWELEDEAANYYTVLQSELFM